MDLESCSCRRCASSVSQLKSRHVLSRCPQPIQNANSPSMKRLHPRTWSCASLSARATTFARAFDMSLAGSVDPVGNSFEHECAENSLWKQDFIFTRVYMRHRAARFRCKLRSWCGRCQLVCTSGGCALFTLAVHIGISCSRVHSSTRSCMHAVQP